MNLSRNAIIQYNTILPTSVSELEAPHWSLHQDGLTSFFNTRMAFRTSRYVTSLVLNLELLRMPNLTFQLIGYEFFSFFFYKNNNEMADVRSRLVIGLCPYLNRWRSGSSMAVASISNRPQAHPPLRQLFRQSAATTNALRLLAQPN
eukprot:SAG31_NODE_5596_length_2432_cov_1.155165_2_plen_147_part_00